MYIGTFYIQFLNQSSWRLGAALCEQVHEKSHPTICHAGLHISQVTLIPLLTLSSPPRVCRDDCQIVRRSRGVTALNVNRIVTSLRLTPASQWSPSQPSCEPSSALLRIVTYNTLYIPFTKRYGTPSIGEI